MATLNVKYQHRLQGPPSSHASTHIYDGFISKIKYDGLLTCGFGISQVLRFKKLVRIGGGCCEPELEQYRERDVAFSDVSVRQVLHRIESYQGQRDEWIKSSKTADESHELGDEEAKESDTTVEKPQEEEEYKQS
ncbi:hypothetical protein PC118_g19270 [Phytophthora cactorum]|uniref:Uncharacterized protein n=1 Tax=Phytophthora cactorum TaxID=29920 RepID=A0A8T1F1M9_9STRA|nr:hypothetical protein PC118_g19270 [Phytophthora cactorum]